MNALIREERAIVSEIHGTTRDYLDAIINISGIPVTIIDTAGIRTTKDIIEELGTKKSKELINKSDLVLLLIDAETGITEEGKQIIELVKNRNIVVVINKIDIKPFDKSTIEDYNFDNIIEISALKNLNINKLEEAILNKVTNLSTTNIQKEILVNTRHKNALLKVIEFLDFAEQSIENNVSYEFIALDVRRSLDYIGEITGEISTDDILDNIFKKFCVGK
jgi:tRNA modification GTPase